MSAPVSLHFTWSQAEAHAHLLTKAVRAGLSSGSRRIDYVPAPSGRLFRRWSVVARGSRR